MVCNRAAAATLKQDYPVYGVADFDFLQGP